MITKLLIGFVRFYRQTHQIFFPPVCRYTPTCSKYMIKALNKHGCKAGLILGLKRIMRCHPWSKSNYWDPVK